MRNRLSDHKLANVVLSEFTGSLHLILTRLCCHDDLVAHVHEYISFARQSELGPAIVPFTLICGVSEASSDLLVTHRSIVTSLRPPMNFPVMSICLECVSLACTRSLQPQQTNT